MKKSVKIKAMLIVGAMLLSATLSSCRALMKDVTMTTSVADNGTTLPVVAGFLKNSSVNENLRDEFMPLAAHMRDITEDSDGRLQIEYGLTELKKNIFGGEYSITMYLSDDSDNIIELKSVKISGMDSVTPTQGDNAQWITSAKMAESALLMQKYGIEFDKAAMSEPSDERYAVETFIKLYESFAGKEADTSDVVVAEDDVVTQKALLLNLIDYYDDFNYQYSDEVYVQRITGLSASILSAIERDVYGRQSESATGEELAGMVLALHGAVCVPLPESDEHSWEELAKVDTDGIIAGMEMTDKPFTRRDAAEFLGKLTKNGPKYSMKYTDRNLLRTEDAAESIWARRAVTHGFMNYYGDSTLFAPWEGLTVANAISSAQCYINTRYSDWAYAENYKWDGTYTRADVIMAAASTAGYFRDRADVDKQFLTKTVVNDRDYDWFFSQKNTGEYSDINCMPSIATMASHWYNKNSKATVKKMRATSSYDEGWTAYHLRNGLSAYKIPYTIADATMENIIEALDNGHIVLAQYSDCPQGVSGHCFVIYGYKNFKDSTTFIVNDSDSLTQRAEIFGRKAGNGDEVESSFAMWTITRFVDDVTVVKSNNEN